MKPTRESYIPKNAAKVSDKLSDAVAYLTTSSTGVPYASIFFGKQAKPIANYRYKNEDQRAKHVTELFESRRASMKRISENRAEAKAFQHSVKAGDIFRTCWGYDQTNVEFFEVTEVRGKFAILREVAQVSESNGSGQDRCVPQSGAYLSPRYEGDDQGLPIRRLIQQGYRNEAHIKIDKCRSGSPWGTRIAGAVIGDPVSKTSSGWGH